MQHAIRCSLCNSKRDMGAIRVYLTLIFEFCIDCWKTKHEECEKFMLEVAAR